MRLLALLLTAQQWVVSPSPATVGDTLWLERRVTTPPGWLVRPTRLARGGVIAPLGDPRALRSDDTWILRYPVTAWATGALSVELPVIWLLGPGGEADSVPGGTALVTVASVLPDTGRPAPQPALAPMWRAPQRLGWPLLAVTIAGVVLGAGIWWRRRGPRAAAVPPPPGPGRPVDDARWMRAGEPRAIAARATGELRAVLAQAVPEAHEGLSTSECLDACARRLPAATVDEVAEVLRSLDRVAFASAHGADVLALARRARAITP